MQVKTMSPAMAVARSYCVENGVPGASGAGYRLSACVMVSFVCSHQAFSMRHHLGNKHETRPYNTRPSQEHMRPDVVFRDELRRLPTRKGVAIARTMAANELDRAEFASCDQTGREVWEEAGRAVDDRSEGAVGTPVGGADEGAWGMEVMRSLRKSTGLRDVPIEVFLRQSITGPSEGKHPAYAAALSVAECLICYFLWLRLTRLTEICFGLVFGCRRAKSNRLSNGTFERNWF
jgi:hypothetical protein